MFLGDKLWRADVGGCQRQCLCLSAFVYKLSLRAGLVISIIWRINGIGKKFSKYTQDYFQSFELKHLCHFNHTYSLTRFQSRLGNVHMPLKPKYWIWTLVRWELNNCMFKYSSDLNESCIWFIKNAILSILSIVLTLYFNCGSSNPLVFGSFIYSSASCIMARIGIV